MGKLSGMAALVTGASKGIGLATAVELGKAGAKVALNYRSDPAQAPAAVEEIRRAGSEAILLAGDVAEQSAVENLVRETVRAFGRLDVAVSNAAYSDRELFYEADLAGFQRTVNVTMWGAFHLLRAATSQLLAQGGGGSIVIISSPHAYIPIPRSMAYNMAKAAIDQMARTAALELTEHKIRVNLIHPGWIDTPGERKFTPDQALKKAGEKLPWKRLGRPDEIGRGVVFLCDPESDYITGSSLLIDGGITLPWWAGKGTAVGE